jgi:23S rRNA pseudoU1915 N3-methylase RlmH
MPKGRNKATQGGDEYTAQWWAEYKENVRPQVEAEILELRARLRNREKAYMETYGEKLSEKIEAGAK